MQHVVDPEIPLTILHHDEHLVFPGYNVMVGQSCIPRDGEHKGTSWAIRKPTTNVAAVCNERIRCISTGHKKLLIIAAIIWYATFILDLGHALSYVPFPCIL